jgi:TRAP-type C4-dicarboxylate transport system permease small subunit
MEQNNDVLDLVCRRGVLIAVLAAIVLTALTFICQFFSADAVNLFKQLSFYAYGWMVYLSLAPMVKRGAFMKIELITGKYSDGARKAVQWISDAIMILLMVVMCIASFQLAGVTLAEGGMNKNAPIPLILAYAAPAAGYILGLVAWAFRLSGKKGGDKA